MSGRQGGGGTDKDSLIGLFSTRATQNISPTTRDVVPVDPTARPTPAAPRQGARPTAASPAHVRSQLSPLASTVLREARRELGNDYNLQEASQGGGGD